MARTASSITQHDWNDNTWTTGTPTTPIKTLSGVTESKTGSFDARTYWQLQVTVDINYDATPTNSVTIYLYGSVDGTNFDDTPMDLIAGDKTTDPEQLTIMLFSPPAYLQIGFVQTGSTDSHDISSVKIIGYN